MPHASIGIDIGGTSIAVGLTNQGTVLEQRELPTPKASLGEFINTIHGLIEPWTAAHPSAPIGACSPGLLDPRTGVTLYASNIPFLKEVNLSELLSGKIGRSVHVYNDANAAAYGEYAYGAARGLPSMMYFTVSTGIGGAFIDHNGVFAGAYGYAADVGHTTVQTGGRTCSCGQAGCLEAYASGTSVTERYFERTGERFAPSTIFYRADNGDEDAAHIRAETAHFAALGLANAVKTFDAAGAVLGGGVVVHNPGFAQLVERELAGFTKNFRAIDLRVAELGSAAGIIGTAALAAERT